MNRLTLMTLGVALLASCQSPPPPAPRAGGRTEAADPAILAEEAAVKAVVERFLVAIGSHDLEALPPMFAPHASIGSIHLVDGAWRSKTYAFEDFYSILEAQTDPSPYREPVSHYAVHVERGGLAFVRADATLIRDDVARSRNIDYFTLIKEDGSWRFLSASYVATPIPAE